MGLLGPGVCAAGLFQGDLQIVEYLVLITVLMSSFNRVKNNDVNNHVYNKDNINNYYCRHYYYSQA